LTGVADGPKMRPGSRWGPRVLATSILCPLARDEGYFWGPRWKTLVMRPLVIVLGALAVVGLVWFMVRRSAA
jgi:hypothetical protein